MRRNVLLEKQQHTHKNEKKEEETILINGKKWRNSKIVYAETKYNQDEQMNGNKLQTNKTMNR